MESFDSKSSSLIDLLEEQPRVCRWKYYQNSRVDFLDNCIYRAGVYSGKLQSSDVTKDLLLEIKEWLLKEFTCR